MFMTGLLDEAGWEDACEEHTKALEQMAETKRPALPGVC